MNYIYFTIFILNIVFAQNWHNHPELDWKTITSDNFRVHYHNGLEEIAIKGLSYSNNQEINNSALVLLLKQ